MHLLALGFALLILGALGLAQDPPPPTQAPPSRAEAHRHSILIRAAKPGYGGFVGDPYPLDFCVVDDEPLGAEAVTVVLKDMADPLQEHRQMRFCGPACEERFKMNPADFTRKADAALIERFGKEYPLDRCLILIQDMLDSNAQFFAYGNRVYRLCDETCILNFSHNTGRYTAVYEKQVIVKQRRRYPLTTCVVTGEPLGEKPVDLVIGARLVRVANAEAAARFYEDPAGYLKKIDEAAQPAATD